MSDRTVRRHLETLEPRQMLNAAPIGQDDVFLTSQDEAIVLTSMLMNDADADGDTLTVKEFAEPDHGAIERLGNGQLRYSPEAGFAGRDSFQYVVQDGRGGTDTAEVVVSVNKPIDGTAARNQILRGVTALNNPVQPGYMVAYGPEATALAYYEDNISKGPLAVAAGWGHGRVVAMPDNQWTEMPRSGPHSDTHQFYENAISWLGETSAKDVNIVTYNSSDNANYLRSAGYTNVHNATSVFSLRNALRDADVFAAGFLGTDPSSSLLDTTADFVRDGGGLLVSEYGPGHRFWWHNDIWDAGGNRLLREAGIGFGSDIIWSKTPIDATSLARGQVDAERVKEVIQGGTSVGRSIKEEAAFNLKQLSIALNPADNLLMELGEITEDRLQTINPTPKTPVTDVLEKGLLTFEMQRLKDLPPDQVTAHRTAEDIYGAIPDDAERTSGTYEVDPGTSGWQSTGFYAAPGEQVTIEVPQSVIRRGYTIRISGHRDKITGRDKWKRVPFGTSREFELDARSITIASAFGGSIYIDVGKEPPSSVGQRAFALRIGNALQQPYFVHNQTTNEQWAQLRNSPAPYAELVSEHVAMSVPSSWVRDLDDPQALMQFWDDVGAWQDYVGALEHLRTAPERFNVDVQISVGWLHAGYPIQGPLEASTDIVDLQTLTTKGEWGYFHELGHQMQARPDRKGNHYTFSGDGEVTVNIFANASLERYVDNQRFSGFEYSTFPAIVMQRVMGEVLDSSKPKFEDKDAYPFYFQLSDMFGWDMYREVFRTYHDDVANNPSELPAKGPERKDEFYIRWSRVSGYDMTQYMVDLWGLEVSDAARREVAAMRLPDFLPAFALVPSSIAVARDASMTIDFSDKGLSFDGTAEVTDVTQPDVGQLRQNDDGTWTYEPPVGFEGETEFTFNVRSSTGYKIPHTTKFVVGMRGALLETYADIDGNSVRDLTTAPNFAANPAFSQAIDGLKAPRNRGHNYGARARAWIVPPTSGRYQFWISSDDGSELKLSTDATPENAQRIAHVDGWTKPEVWTTLPSQRSKLIELEAGKKYYLEALHKERVGGDHLTVAWQGPGFTRQVIPEENLLMYYVGNARPWAVDDQAESQGEAVVIDVLANDTDRDGDRLQIEHLSAPSGGTATIRNGKIEYQPAIGHHGEDSFTYTVSDGNGGQASARVVVQTAQVQAPSISGRITADGRIVLAGDKVDLTDVKFQSAAGHLVPTDDATPFSTIQQNSPNGVFLSSLGDAVHLDGELTTAVRYTGNEPASDLKATFSTSNHTDVAFEVVSELDCNGDGVTDLEDLDCSCGAGHIDAALAQLQMVWGDMDGGGVDFSDFLILARHFGSQDAAYTEGDLDCNGRVDFGDFLVLSRNFGKSFPAA